MDVAVVGGGFTGLSAALALAKEGASVAVLEAGRVAAGASGRNGGHVNNGTAVDYGTLVASRGREAARALYRAYDTAVDTVERIVREQQIQCDFRRCGKIKLAAKPAHYDKLARSFELLHGDADPDTVLVPPDRMRDEVGSDRFHGGLVHTKSAQMHMGRFGAGLAGAAQRAGARIYEDAAVSALSRAGSGHLVATTKGNVSAKQVLVATGPSSKGPFGYFRRRIIPVGSFILATEPLEPSQLDSIMPTRRNATTTMNVGHYFRISPDNRLIWGGRARFALSNPGSDVKSGRILRGICTAPSRNSAGRGSITAGAGWWTSPPTGCRGRASTTASSTRSGSVDTGRRCRCIWAKSWPRCWRATRVQTRSGT